MANYDVNFREKYRGYSAYLSDKNKSSEKFSDQYSDWSTTHRDSITSAMQAANLQQTQFASEEVTLQTLQTLGESTTGRQQALQVGNQIAAQEVRQLQKLRALMMAQMQMQASYMANEANEKDFQTARSRKYFDIKIDTKIGNEKIF